MPGMSDHNIVSADFCIKLKILKQVSQEIYLYHKANWDMIRQDMIRLWNDPLFVNDGTIVLLNSCGQSLEILPYIV